jgi:eukaryotic-like serine/threonine-protein kinase
MNGGGSARDGQPEPFAVKPGVLIDGRYRIVERIGGGGMGSVYRVEHLRLGTSFALKLMRRELVEDERMLQRFERESRAAARLASEHVVPIVDSGMLPDGTPYFVMQLLEGQDLRGLLRECGRLLPVRAVNLAIDACRGLHAAHSAGLVHRDLKPANLFVTRGDDGRDVVKLLDFGVVKHSDDVTTQPGALIGTTRYMAPEQIGADYRVGPHTDLFALGVILYECLAGEPPFAGDTTERVLYAIMTAEPEPLHQRCAGLPAGLSGLVARSLQKHPEARFKSALEFAAELLPFAGARARSAGSDAGEFRVEPDSDHTHVDSTSRARGPRMLSGRPEGRRSWWFVPAAVSALAASGLGFLLGRSQRVATEEAPITRDLPARGPARGAPQADASAVPTPNPVSQPAASVEPGAVSTSSASGVRLLPSSPRSSDPRPIRQTTRERIPPPRPLASASANTSPRPPPTALDPQNPYAD